MTEIGDIIQSGSQHDDLSKAEGLARDLRALADVVESTPQHYESVWRFMFDAFSTYSWDREEYVAWAQDMVHFLTREKYGKAGGINKRYADSSAIVEGYLGQLDLKLYAPRDQVCTKVVKGTKTVMVPNPDAPRVEKIIDDIEWVCDGRIHDVTRGQDGS